ncbi:MAG: nuclear transport factor 2 family protein [Pseudomonadota bacterium]
MASSRWESKVIKYYNRVDAGDVDWVINLFAEDAVYDRASEVYKDRTAIEQFYRSERKIDGRHTLTNVASSNDTVLVDGEFQGCGADGSSKKIGFADCWRFNEAGKVTSRNTYLAIGSDYVRD